MTTPGQLTVLRDPNNQQFGNATFRSFSGHRMYLYTEKGDKAFAFNLAPREIDYSELGSEWVETDRSGDSPLLQFKGKRLVQMKFSFTLTDPRDYYTSQTQNILDLQELSQTQDRILVRYSSLESGMWRITGFGFKTMLRHPLTNDPIRCECDLTLTRAQDPDPAGPLAGPPVSSTASATKAAPRSVTVQQGDTLSSIAMAMYGTSLLWQQIWDANPAVVRPWLIYAGQRLLIP